MDDLRCCLADFGLSLFAETQALDSSSGMSKGSARWLAPEYIDPDVVIDRAFITARDIYAYGCTVVEVGPLAYCHPHSYAILPRYLPASPLSVLSSMNLPLYMR